VPVVAVSAHSTMVDVTDSPAIAIGDEVVLLGKQGDAEITAVEMARATGESVYHLLATIPREVIRIWN
jgi:alanine racemase